MVSHKRGKCRVGRLGTQSKPTAGCRLLRRMYTVTATVSSTATTIMVMMTARLIAPVSPSPSPLPCALDVTEPGAAVGVKVARLTDVVVVGFSVGAGPTPNVVGALVEVAAAGTDVNSSTSFTTMVKEPLSTID